MNNRFNIFMITLQGVRAEHLYHSIRYCVRIYQQRIYLTENSMLCYGPLVSELGGPECMVPTNPVIGGPVPPCSAAYGWTVTS